MIVQGLLVRRSITHELANQKIAFPSGTALPDPLGRCAGEPVRTGIQARAFSDLIADHVARAAGGRTYAAIADEWLAGGRTDERLARLRETAFMARPCGGRCSGGSRPGRSPRWSPGSICSWPRSAWCSWPWPCTWAESGDHGAGLAPGR